MERKWLRTLVMMCIGSFFFCVPVLMFLFGCQSGKCTDASKEKLPCAAGFIGVKCDVNINECASSPCKNGGNCADGVNGYTCACAAGYGGANCDFNTTVCTSSPCQNGGNCTAGVNGYTCECAAAYSGAHCETNTSKCASNPCGVNSLSCTNLPNDYNCTCKPDYSGKRCEISFACTVGCTGICRCPNVNETCIKHLGRCVCKTGHFGTNCTLTLP